MPSPAHLPKFVKDYLATEQGSAWYKRKTSPSKQDLHGKDSLGAMSLATAHAESFTNLLQCHECLDSDSGDEYGKELGGLALTPLTQVPSPPTESSPRISKTNKTVSFDEDIQRTASYYP